MKKSRQKISIFFASTHFLYLAHSSLHNVHILHITINCTYLPMTVKVRNFEIDLIMFHYQIHCQCRVRVNELWISETCRHHLVMRQLIVIQLRTLELQYIVCLIKREFAATRMHWSKAPVEKGENELDLERFLTVDEVSLSKRWQLIYEHSTSSLLWT